MSIIAYAKAHPYKTGAIVFVGGLAVLFILRSQLSSSTSSTSSTYNPNTDPNVINAEIAAASQQQAIQAQATAQANQIQGEYNIAALQAGVQTTLGTLQAHTADNVSADNLAATLAQTEASRQVSLAGISAQEAVQNAGIAAQVANTQLTTDAEVNINSQNNATTQFVAQQTAATEAQLAAINGQVAITQSNNQTLATVEQTWSAEKIAKSNASAGMFGSALGAIGGIVGAII